MEARSREIMYSKHTNSESESLNKHKPKSNKRKAPEIDFKKKYDAIVNNDKRPKPAFIDFNELSFAGM